jgi:uncharacterized protein YoxC
LIYQFSNPLLTINTSKKTLDPGVVTPSKPHSLKTPNPLAQAIPLLDQKSKKLVNTPATSSGNKTKKPIDNSPMPSTSIDPAPKNLQEVIQQDFPSVPTNRKGANRFNRGYFHKSAQITRGKTYEKPPTTSDLIQVSFDLEIPHKILREVSAEELEPHRKTKSEPTSPHKPPVIPTSQMPTPDPKTDRLSTSFKGSKPSYEISDLAPTIENLQHGNNHLLQQLEKNKTLDEHIHHDNAILQVKVNSLQRLVDQMTNTNHSLKAQLKHHKRNKTKSPGKEGEDSKANISQQVYSYGAIHFCSGTCKILGVGVMLGL